MLRLRQTSAQILAANAKFLNYLLPRRVPSYLAFRSCFPLFL